MEKYEEVPEIIEMWQEGTITLSQCLRKISEIARHYEHMAFLVNVYEDMESEFAQYTLSKIEETLNLKRGVA